MRSNDKYDSARIAGKTYQQLARRYMSATRAKKWLLLMVRYHAGTTRSGRILFLQSNSKRDNKKGKKQKLRTTFNVTCKYYGSNDSTGKARNVGGKN